MEAGGRRERETKAGGKMSLRWFLTCVDCCAYHQSSTLLHSVPSLCNSLNVVVILKARAADEERVWVEATSVYSEISGTMP